MVSTFPFIYLPPTLPIPFKSIYDFHVSPAKYEHRDARDHIIFSAFLRAFNEKFLKKCVYTIIMFVSPVDFHEIWHWGVLLNVVD
jgi:hypothetical protein